MSADPGMRVRVSVPATSANLGPGFDSLGIALELRNSILARFTDEDGVTVRITGEGDRSLPRGGRNLVARSMTRTLRELGVERRGLLIEAHNAIPQAGGLGSSASAVVAGCAAALALARGEEPRLDEVFEHAAAQEGHPDNAAPAIYGGATIAYHMRDGRARSTRLTPHAEVSAVLYVPDFSASTARIRKLQPRRVPLADAVFNVSRAALLVHAIERDPSCLLDATDDQLHQPYRKDAMRASADLIRRLRRAGFAAFLSGAGPTVMALVASRDVDAACSFDVGRNSATWSVRHLAIAAQGATIALQL